MTASTSRRRGPVRTQVSGRAQLSALMVRGYGRDLRDPFGHGRVGVVQLRRVEVRPRDQGDLVPGLGEVVREHRRVGGHTALVRVGRAHHGDPQCRRARRGPPRPRQSSGPSSWTDSSPGIRDPAPHPRSPSSRSEHSGIRPAWHWDRARLTRLYSGGDASERRVARGAALQRGEGHRRRRSHRGHALPQDRVRRRRIHRRVCPTRRSEAGAVVVRHPVNLGQGAALQTGFDYALTDPDMRYCVTYDADGQHQLVRRRGHARADQAGRRPGRIRLALPRRPHTGRRASRSSSCGWLSPTPTSRPAPGSPTRTTGCGSSSAASSNGSTSPRTGWPMPPRSSPRSGPCGSTASRWPTRRNPVHILYTDYSRAKGQSLWNAVNILAELIWR